MAPQRVKEQVGQLAFLDGGIPRVRLRPVSGLPGQPPGPRTGNQLALHRPVQALVGLLSGIWVLEVPKSQPETRTGESSSASSSSNQASMAPIPQLLTPHPFCHPPLTNPPGGSPAPALEQGDMFGKVQLRKGRTGLQAPGVGTTEGWR